DGVSPFVIDECLEVYSSEMEYEKALSLIQKLFDENTARSPKALVQNIRNRLFNKGFSQNVVDQAINDFSFDIPKSHTKMLLKKEYDKVYKRYSKKYEGSVLKNKMITFLIQKGYDYEDIVEVWEEEN
ncbi:MAG: hypothetical protein U0L85_02255, partial [Bacilli bacterium]|nr:hypothetical protein [Bacilli bacterium]